MAKYEPKKEFRNLALWVWLVLDRRRRPVEYLVDGRDEDLLRVAELVDLMVADFGYGTRRFFTNPPAGQEIPVRIRWLSELRIKVSKDPIGEPAVREEAGVVEITLDRSRVAGFTDWIRSYVEGNRRNRFGIGHVLVEPAGESRPGVRLSPDWLGVE